MVSQQLCHILSFTTVTRLQITDEERNQVFETISTSQKGESLVWYKFGDDWTHPYYHKSDGQSALESGLLSLIPTWNKVSRLHQSYIAIWQCPLDPGWLATFFYRMINIYNVDTKLNFRFTKDFLILYFQIFSQIV